MEKSDGIKAGEKTFGFPLNIKQMGNIDRELKIYVEDYVYTYLWRYAKAKGNSEKLAVLLGRHYSVDGQDTVVVSGAVDAKYTAEENGNEIFKITSGLRVVTDLDGNIKRICGMEDHEIDANLEFGGKSVEMKFVPNQKTIFKNGEPSETVYIAYN